MWHSGFLHNTSFIVSLTDTNAPFHRRAETQRWCKIWCGERTRCFWQVKLCYSGFVETMPTNEAAKWEHVQHSSQREWVVSNRWKIHSYSLLPCSQRNMERGEPSDHCHPWEVSNWWRPIHILSGILRRPSNTAQCNTTAHRTSKCNKGNCKSNAVSIIKLKL